MKFTIAVLITAHNRKKETLKCLSNLFRQEVLSGYSFEVYLVDDGCTDGTAEIVLRNFPSVKVIKGDGTLFWNRGMYLAWTTAAKQRNYDFYLWLNDDTMLNENALETLLNTSLQKQDRSIIIGSTSAILKTKKVTYGGRNHKEGLLVPVKEPLPCDYFNGNVVLIPKAVYNKVGTNDPVFHHALGDFDYGLRASKLGVKMFVAPGFLGKCDLHESLPTWCNTKQPFNKRWKAFRSPLGNNPEEFFVFEKRHGGLAKAIYHYITNHVRVCFPKLWENDKNDKYEA